jgi:hypothetical protein
MPPPREFSPLAVLLKIEVLFAAMIKRALPVTVIPPPWPSASIATLRETLLLLLISKVAAPPVLRKDAAVQGGVLIDTNVLRIRSPVPSADAAAAAVKATARRG